MVTQSVAEMIHEQLVLEVEGIDRLCLNGYIPMLQTEGGFIHFVREGFADRLDGGGGGHDGGLL